MRGRRALFAALALGVSLAAAVAGWLVVDRTAGTRALVAAGLGPEPTVYSEVALDDGRTLRLIRLGDDMRPEGLVHMLDGAGAVVWESPVEVIGGKPLVDADSVYVREVAPDFDTAHINRLSLADGALRWSSAPAEPAGWQANGIWLAGGQLLDLSGRERPVLRGLRSTDGVEAWRLPLPPPHANGAGVHVLERDGVATVLGPPGYLDDRRQWALSVDAAGEATRLTSPDAVSVCLTPTAVVFVDGDGAVHAQVGDAPAAIRVAHLGAGVLRCARSGPVTLVGWSATGERAGERPPADQPDADFDPQSPRQVGCALLALAPDGTVAWATAFHWGELYGPWPDPFEQEAPASFEFGVRQVPEFIGEEVGYEYGTAFRFELSQQDGAVRSLGPASQPCCTDHVAAEGDTSWNG